MGEMKIKDNVFVQNNKNILDSILQDNERIDQKIEKNELDISKNANLISNNLNNISENLQKNTQQDDQIDQNTDNIRANGVHADMRDAQFANHFGSLLEGVEQNTLIHLKRMSNKIEQEFDTTSETDDLTEFDSILQQKNVSYRGTNVNHYSLIENDMML
jgi:hypothetical protein